MNNMDAMNNTDTVNYTTISLDISADMLDCIARNYAKDERDKKEAKIQATFKRKLARQLRARLGILMRAVSPDPEEERERNPIFDLDPTLLKAAMRLNIDAEIFEALADAAQPESHARQAYLYLAAGARESEKELKEKLHGKEAAE